MRRMGFAPPLFVANRHHYYHHLSRLDVEWRGIWCRAPTFLSLCLCTVYCTSWLLCSFAHLAPRTGRNKISIIHPSSSIIHQPLTIIHHPSFIIHHLLSNIHHPSFRSLLDAVLTTCHTTTLSPCPPLPLSPYQPL